MPVQVYQYYKCYLRILFPNYRYCRKENENTRQRNSKAKRYCLWGILQLLNNQDTSFILCSILLNRCKSHTRVEKATSYHLRILIFFLLPFFSPCRSCILRESSSHERDRSVVRFYLKIVFILRFCIILVRVSQFIVIQ